MFGFPDLYDVDDTSEGIGNWCLMAGGSWNGGGDVPAHPSAWCKVQQGWTTVTNVTTNGTLSISDVKTSRNVHRLWKDGAGGSEYFLLENRQRSGFDQKLPADGLLIWHIDEAQADNTDENHYKVALMQADAKRDMELAHNRGDAGDPYPGSSGNTSFSATSTPSSKSYAGQDTCVSVITTSPSGAVMTATVSVRCGKAIVKDSKDLKDRIKDGKEIKELAKDRKDLKDRFKDRIKDTKELAKDRKDHKDRFEGKFFIRDTGGVEGGGGSFAGVGGGAIPELNQAIAELESRVAALEALAGVDANVEPFIGSELRPDLVGGPDYSGRGDLHERMAAGDRDAKIAFDSLPQS